MANAGSSNIVALDGEVQRGGGPDYTVQAYNGSDSGDGDLRGQIGKIPRGLSVDVVATTYAIPILRQHGKRMGVLSRTQPRGKNPGSWYVKGYNETRYTQEQIEQRIEANRQNRKYRNRECYIITL